MQHEPISGDPFPDRAQLFRNALACLVSDSGHNLQPKKPQALESKMRRQNSRRCRNTFAGLAASHPIAHVCASVQIINCVNAAAAEKYVRFNISDDEIVLSSGFPFPITGADPFDAFIPSVIGMAPRQPSGSFSDGFTCRFK